MKGLYLESEFFGISLDLLDVSSDTVMLGGASGFGFPQIEVEYDAGAGDGSVFRSSRVPFRNLDVPIVIQAPSAVDLDDVCNVLARALSQEVKLRLIDNASDSWILRCRHVGGGDFAYGVDNEGERLVTMTLQLRAGQPFWERERRSISVINPAPAGRSDFTLNNEGSAPAFPLIRVEGPFTGLTIHTPTNGLITVSGTIPAGERVVIDTEMATVTRVNALGVESNLYASVGPSPDFFSLPAGFSQVGVSLSSGVGASTAILLAHNPRRHVML